MLFSSKDLRKLIIPLMFEQLLAVLVGLVDTLMVSQSGEAAVAGVALVDISTGLSYRLWQHLRQVALLFAVSI